jgi:hypothetical protein
MFVILRQIKDSNGKPIFEGECGFKAAAIHNSLMSLAYEKNNPFHGNKFTLMKVSDLPTEDD